jgi:ribonucleoside-diphosphate reductase alpha chain
MQNKDKIFLASDNEVNPYLALLDPLHQEAIQSVIEDPIIYDVWKDKYRWGDEDFTGMCYRVARAINERDGEDAVREAFFAMSARILVPAGRILSGAGTPKRVTMVNCFVNHEIKDEMESIQDAMKCTALSMQQGGGMGTDFSPIRPEGALLVRTHSRASGPLPFMDQMNAGSLTIRSAGERRGAMMGTLCDTHPDLPKFIVAKQQKGRLTEFNVSILVSDAFMSAVADDEEWLLYFHVPPFSRDAALEEHDFVDEEGVQQFVYSVWKARDLYDLIMRNTYEWSEPGVIFIDRINQLNNLQHIEQIRCTNPCGEQPLPSNGACNLGHINLAVLVKNPFTEQACFNWDLLKKMARIAQRFLDNVIDVTLYPMPEQQEEQRLKRRTGLGITGLADALMQMRMRYGSPQAVDFSELIMRTIALESYGMNVQLAIEKGHCPAFPPGMEESSAFWAQRLPHDLKVEIRKYGLRNGVALTIAPTGTTSIVFGNNDGSGCECAFAHTYERRVRIPEEGNANAYRTYSNLCGYTHSLWRKMTGKDEWPSYFVTAQDLSVADHLTMQAALQRWVDASVSKTINLAPEIPYEEFKQVYELAYALGAKGCTTYRPSDVRGSILTAGGGGSAAQNPPMATAPSDTISKRPEMLEGYTYQIKWPKRDAALYLTVNEDEHGYVREILCASKDSTSFEWVTALTLMITAIFKKGGNVDFVAEELKQVQSVTDGCWVDGKFYGSLVAYIGHILDRHFQMRSGTTATAEELPPTVAVKAVQYTGDTCPSCKAPALIKKEGCKSCTNCGWSNCG